MKARKYATGGPIGKALKKKTSSAYEARREESRAQYAESADAYRRQMTLNRAAAASQQGDAERSQKIASNFKGMHQQGISSQEVATGARTPEAAAKARRRR
jgi:hypothetical protein